MLCQYKIIEYFSIDHGCLNRDVMFKAVFCDWEGERKMTHQYFKLTYCQGIDSYVRSRAIHS